MFELMMMMVIIVPIIVIIIHHREVFCKTQSRPKNAGGNHRKKTRIHTMPQGGRGAPPQADPP